MSDGCLSRACIHQNQQLKLGPALTCCMPCQERPGKKSVRLCSCTYGAGIVNRCNWMLEQGMLLPHHNVAFKTATSFVDSIWEMFGPLLAGQPLPLSVACTRALSASLNQPAWA